MISSTKLTKSVVKIFLSGLRNCIEYRCTCLPAKAGRPLVLFSYLERCLYFVTIVILFALIKVQHRHVVKVCDLPLPAGRRNDAKLKNNCPDKKIIAMKLYVAPLFIIYAICNFKTGKRCCASSKPPNKIPLYVRVPIKKFFIKGKPCA